MRSRCRIVASHRSQRSHSGRNEAEAGQCDEVRVGGYTPTGGGADGDIMLNGTFVPESGGCPGGFEVGDVNMDGNINLLDVGPFVAAVSGGGYVCEADINEDGIVNLLDVDPFVDLLGGP